MKNILSWIHNHLGQIENLGLFMIMGFVGTIIKIYKEPEDPRKWRIARFFSELLVSLLMATTVYVVNMHFFKFPELLIMVICVWAGSLSGSIYKYAEILLSVLFKGVQAGIKKWFPPFCLTLGSMFFKECAVQPQKQPQPQPQSTECIKKKDNPKESTIDWEAVINIVFPILKIITPIKF